MKRVIIESPYAGDIPRNTEYARRCVRDSLERGEAPIASHLLFPQPGILKEEASEERMWGIWAGLAWVSVCDLVLFYDDYGQSGGMKNAAYHARAHQVPIERRTIGKNPGASDAE